MLRRLSLAGCMHNMIPDIPRENGNIGIKFMHTRGVNCTSNRRGRGYTYLYLSVHLAIIASGNGLLPIGQQVIIRNN